MAIPPQRHVHDLKDEAPPCRGRRSRGGEQEASWQKKKLSKADGRGREEEDRRRAVMAQHRSAV
jgi:hypothetical protein